MSIAEVAETTYTTTGWEHEPLRLIVRRVAHQADALSDDPRARRKRTIAREQLNLGVAGEADVVYGYSFILCDLDGTVAQVEQHHRDRAQVEERIKDAKLGVSPAPAAPVRPGRQPRLAALLRLGAQPPRAAQRPHVRPRAPRAPPRRRQAKFVRRMLLCVAARVIHDARQIILRLPAGLPSAPAFQAAYTAARGLAPPALTA